MEKNQNFSDGIQNILVCEDHRLVQVGLEVSIRKIFPCLQKLDFASTGKEAIAFLKKDLPDILFLDLGLPDVQGLELVERIKEFWPDLRIMVITSLDNPAMLLRVKEIGVSGILQKVSSLEQLEMAMNSIGKSHSEPFLDPGIRSIIKAYEKIEFTPREYEILTLITQGLSNQQIAEKLGCALTTIRFHRSNIMEKANVRNAAELTAWFLQGQRHGH